MSFQVTMLTCMLQNLLTIAEAATDEATKAAIRHLANDAYADEINAKRVSVLDILERYPSVDLPIGEFLLMMPSMRIRQ